MEGWEVARDVNPVSRLGALASSSGKFTGLYIGANYYST